MKKLVVILCVLSLLLLVGCASTFNQELLRPTEYSLTEKLPNLKIKNGTSDIGVSQSNLNQVSANTYYYTILEREMEQNICDFYGEPMGSIELVLVYDDVEYGYWPMVLGIWGPALFGVPVCTYEYNIEFEIRIYDNVGRRIWKTDYYDSMTGVGTLYNMDTNPPSTSKRVELYKQMIERLKTDLNRDSDVIKSRLQKGMPNSV